MSTATFDFSGRHALITGGTSGIGAGIARGFADAGATVTALGLDSAAAIPYPGVTLVEADVTDQAQLDSVVAGLERIDAVVTCAGLIRRSEEHDPEVFAEVLNVNLTGTMRTLTAAKAKLVESGGAAVAIASILTFAAGPLVPGYSASKGGVKQLVQSLAGAWAPEGVRINTIAPGWINTPLTDAHRTNYGAYADEAMGRASGPRWSRTVPLLRCRALRDRCTARGRWGLSGGLSDWKADERCDRKAHGLSGRIAR